MQITVLKSKLHRATVTGANIEYEGSISVDAELLEACAIVPYEQVHVVDIDNGARLVTYAIESARGGGQVVINGAAARLVNAGHTVIIMAYCSLTIEEASTFSPTIVRLGEGNRIIAGAEGYQEC